MKVTKATGKRERRVLTGMIVDKTVLSRIASKFNDQMFGEDNKWANLVAKWCVQYYKKYGEAPKGQIESVFDNWAAKHKKKQTVELVEKFLANISGEYEELAKDTNAKYLIDLAGDLFNEIQMEGLRDQLDEDLGNGKPEEALKKVKNYHQLEIGVGAGINLFMDKDNMANVFTEQEQIMIKYPGELGRFFAPAMTRGSFVAFMGPEKRGKSWWLLDCAYRALLQRRRVAFFEAGDNSERQVTKRFLIRASQHPAKPCTVLRPTHISFDSEQEEADGGGKMALVSHEEKVFTKALSFNTASKAAKRLLSKKVKSKKPYIKMSCHPNSSLSIYGIESILQLWSETEEWEPEVIVVDYADILDMSVYRMDGRDRINEAWKHLRRLSQEYNCLVVTATQADAGSYNLDTISRSNFSEDKRKIAHVTGMVGINQTNNEKENGLFRLNWLALRESKYNEQWCIHVASCLELGNPAVRSCSERN